MKCLESPHSLVFPSHGSHTDVIHNIHSVAMALYMLLLLMPCVTFSQNRIANRIPDLCLTIEGERCVFPFMYKGKEYHQCTYASSPSPWCSTLVDNNGTTVTNRWGDCDTSVCEVENTPGTTCTTVGGPSSGMPCIFPFRHNGVTYTTCTTDTLGQPWCSTATNSDGQHQQGQGKYGLCPSTCPGAEAVVTECIPGTTWTKECNTCICSSTGQATCTTTTCRSSTCTPGTTWSAECNTCVCSSTGEPVCTKNMCPGRCVVEAGPDNGAECVFPFSWGGKTYRGCTPWTYGGTFQGRGWCSTKTNEEGLHVNGEGNYGFCSSDCPLATDSDIRDRFTRIRDEDDAIVFQEPNNLAPQ